MITPYYCPSGRIPLRTFPIALLSSLLILPAAWCYAWLTIHAPFVFNFFIAFGFSAALGFIVRCVATYGKVRNPRWMGRMGIVFGLIGWYCQWAAWIAITAANMGAASSGGKAIGMFATVAVDPWGMVRFAWSILDIGTLTVGGWTLTGVALVAVWLMELWMHLILPPMMGRMRAEHPFCEVSNQWAETIQVERRFAPVDPGMMVTQLETDPGQIAFLLTPQRGLETTYFSKVTLFRCPASESYLSLNNIVVTPDRKGRDEQKEVPVLEYLRLPDMDLDALAHDLAAKPAEPAGAAGNADDSGAPVAPQLQTALSHLEAGRFEDAHTCAAAHVAVSDVAVRADANRLCALACSRLGRWQEALGYWRALSDAEPTVHNALQVATSSVMAGDMAAGMVLLDKARSWNAECREVPPMQMLTNFVSAMAQAGHADSAMPYLDEIRQAYVDVGIMDCTFLYLRGMPFFSAFLSNSKPIIEVALDRETGRRWYASMLPSLDEGGKAELNEWLQSAFGDAPDRLSLP